MTSNTTCRYLYLRENKDTWACEDSQSDVPSSFFIVIKNQKEINKKFALYPHSGILPHRKRQWSTETCKNMYDSQRNHAFSQRNQTVNMTYCMISFIWNYRKGETTVIGIDEQLLRVGGDWLWEQQGIWEDDVYTHTHTATWHGTHTYKTYVHISHVCTFTQCTPKPIYMWVHIYINMCIYTCL